jgi:hypothetical protein
MIPCPRPPLPVILARACEGEDPLAARRPAALDAGRWLAARSAHIIETSDPVVGQWVLALARKDDG